MRRYLRRRKQITCTFPTFAPKIQIFDRLDELFFTRESSILILSVVRCLKLWICEYVAKGGRSGLGRRIRIHPPHYQTECLMRSEASRQPMARAVPSSRSPTVPCRFPQRSLLSPVLISRRAGCLSTRTAPWPFKDLLNAPIVVFYICITSL